MPENNSNVPAAAVTLPVVAAFIARRCASGTNTSSLSLSFFFDATGAEALGCVQAYIHVSAT